MIKINLINTFIGVLICLLLYGCAKKPQIIEPPIQREVMPDIETLQKGKQILNRVANIATNHSLDTLGKSTMSESVDIMQLGESIVPLLVKQLKVSQNWKFRFWIVDILGYIESRDSIIPLIEVIEDNQEKEIVRLRACASIREIRFPEAVRHLLISRDIVKNSRIRKEIEKSIEFFR